MRGTASTVLITLITILACSCSSVPRPVFRSAVPPYKSNRVILATASSTDGIVVFRNTGELSRPYAGATGGPCQLSESPKMAAFDRSGKVLGVVYEKKLIAYRVAGCEEIAGFEFNRRVTSLDISPKGDSMIMGGEDGSVYLWKFHQSPSSLFKGNPIHRYIGHSTLVSDVAFHPGGLVFMSGDWNGTLLVWERYDADSHQGRYDKGAQDLRFLIEKPARAIARKGAPERVEHLYISKSGEWTLVLFEDGHLEVFYTRGTKLLWRAQTVTGLPLSASFWEISKNLIKVAVLNREREVVVFTIDTEQELAKDGVQELGRYFFADAEKVLFDHNGSLYVGSDDGFLHRQDLVKEEE